MRLLLIMLGVLVLGAGGFFVFSLSRLSHNAPATDQMELGVQNGNLKACPESSNCVSTQADPSDEVHYVKPIPYEGERSAVVEALLGWLRERDDVEIVIIEDDYLHAVFYSRVFRFPDDVELYFPPGEAVVDLRSASRVGRNDMGANRERYNAIREVVAEIPADRVSLR